ncbi:ATP-binding protein [Haloechinothrix sp. YIM 98757]|uniref:ATP-binding protein n=1 Tax=Haloechinothrix aidingensis TaxID=2752311 RepID=A0A838AEZ3_9PSEU|nr:ATP-binding protein [Haloechinothrix aidingensis]
MSEQRRHVEIDSRDDIELRLGADVVHLPIVRSVAANIAMRADFDLDAISDLELAVDEACATLIALAAAESILGCRFTIGSDEIAMTASVCSDHTEAPSTSSFGWQVLNTLTDSAVTWSEPDGVGSGQHLVSIELSKRRPVVAG